MLGSPEQQAAFRLARRNTDRSACERWVQAQGVSKDNPDVYEAAKARWRTLQLLAAPELHQLASAALPAALGQPVDTSTPFPSMIWFGGAQDTYGGNRFKGSIGDFVTHVLVNRSTQIAKKRCGWVVTPTSNTDGRRINASTTAMHALNLDCDGRGQWNAMMNALTTAGVAHIVYQSGGWNPTTPKWHVLIPLARPFDTTSEVKIESWKAAYNAARVVFGALARLPGEGFDPTVETPCIPVFITERREETDPPRLVIWQPGRALDIEKLVTILPPSDPPELRAPRQTSTASIGALGNDKRENVTQALCVPMSKILSGRRDLYMCLAGALLDRGLEGDDMIAIIEEISLRCPGDPRYTDREIEEKHKQHVHDAETTVRKHESGGEFTRVGTLHQSWPEVARALDGVIPNPDWLDSIEWLEKRRTAQTATVVAQTTNVLQQPVPVDLEPLRKRVREIKSDKMKDDSRDQKIRGFILSALLDGGDLIPRINGVVVDTPREKPYDRSSAADAALWAIVLSPNVDDDLLSFDALAILFRPSLVAMCAPNETPDAQIIELRGSFQRAVTQRHKNEIARKEANDKRGAAIERHGWGA